jgi:23S rRNA (cytidine1920-2'-O)/16S rRNA (cytidine1409-2'-O)-methyltransferase
MPKRRLDVLLVERGLASSRAQAQRIILAGQVRTGDRILDKAGALVPEDVPLTVVSVPRYVSRGGLKLEAALHRFGVDVRGWVVADVGASTGGFTDCLLQHGAARVYAIDVGYGQIAWSLRQDPRVVVLERTNIRYLAALPEPCDLATVDVSFISLRMVLPAVQRLLKGTGGIIALIKPQFEAGRGKVGKGGVVRNVAQQRQILYDLLGWAQTEGLALQGLMTSPLWGPAGNVEFLAWLGLGQVETPISLEGLIEKAMKDIPAVLAGRVTRRRSL